MVDSLAAGETAEGILALHPTLTPDAIRGAIAYAALLAREESSLWSVRRKLDESVSPHAVQTCVDLGHDASSAIAEGLGGKPDAEVLVVATRESRVLVTVDRGFGNVRRYPPGSHAAILVLRPLRYDYASMIQLLKQFLASAETTAYEGCVVIVSPARVRVRRPS